jgi:hypothetical protein
MNYTADSIIEILNSKQIPYSRFLKNKENILKPKELDISVVIGAKGRNKQLEKCLDYFKYAIDQEKDLKIDITVVQQDVTSSYKYTTDKNGFNYIFIPLNDSETDEQFSPALTYNTGFISNQNAKNYIFHCVDTLVPHDFFNILKGYLAQDNFSWLQNFSGKSLYYLNPEQTKKIYELKGLFNLRVMNGVEKGGPGAPGGSITVSKQTLLDIGGYDPELFYGWAPEDSFFWTKLITTKRKIDAIRSCHIYSHDMPEVYADNPPIKLYHMHHEHVPNYKWTEMHELHDSFWSFPHEEKKKYIEAKSKKFLKDIKI